MKAKEIKKGIYWVGAIDWNLRNFHGYSTQRGSTYNSYLIVDDKVTLVDNVKAKYSEELIKRISSIIDPSKIDYIIQNHIEMDHSGSLPRIMEIAKNAKIFASPKGVEGLPKHYGKDWNFEIVKSGDSLNLGKRTLKFVQTPMVHWPDNMVSYCPEEKLIFSNDAFGQHIASSERIDKNFPQSVLMHEAAKYYANIVLPYGRQVKKALEVIKTLEIDTICPSHGLILQKYIPELLKRYVKWSNNDTDEKALIIYDTMWNSTGKIADTIFDAFEEKGITAELCSVQHNHISDVMTKVLSAKYICVGSPTLNNNILPTVASFLAYFKGLSPKGRIGLAFGSYGWGGQSVGIIEKKLEESKFKILEKIRMQYVPTEEDLKKEKEKLIKQLGE